MQITDKIKIGESTPQGTRIHGILAYAGFSRNRRIYYPEQLAKGDNLDLPILLNHASFIAIENVPEELLPMSYRLRLLNEETIVVGHGHTTWIDDDMVLMHDGIITDPFYSQKHILEQLFVSQGILYLDDQKPDCSPSGETCYVKPNESEYQEYSLVFRSGFPLAKVITESANTSLSVESAFRNQMSKDKIDENCKDCPKGLENQDPDARTDGTMTQAGNCGPGFSWNADTGECEKVPEQSIEPTVPGLVEQNTDDDKDDDNDKDKKPATSTNDKKEDAKESDLEIAVETIKEYRKKIDELYPETKPDGANRDNADTRSHDRAQEQYVEGLKTKLALKEAESKTMLKAIEANIRATKSKAVEQSKIAQSRNQTRTAALEVAENSVASWMNLIAKGDENVSSRKVYKLGKEYVNQHVVKKFKEQDEFGHVKMIPYTEKMTKLYGAEATNVVMAGGTDPENFLRTASELVLIYPDGDIVTPGQQFCETKELAPGQKEVLFYDMNKPVFAATDESTVNAGGSGFAVAPSDLTINASGGKATPEGALVRVGYTDNEEIPIDIPKNVNMGFSFAAEVAKNKEIFNTAYNVDTAYNPATDDKRPKGGGDKGVLDSSSNRHWLTGDGV